MTRAVKRRLDAELVEQGYFSDVREAERAVMAGLVSSAGERLTKPGQQVKAGVALHVKGSRKQSAQGLGTYVSRGGLKLEGALLAFGLDVNGLNCVDGDVPPAALLIACSSRVPVVLPRSTWAMPSSTGGSGATSASRFLNVRTFAMLTRRS